ncbi:MAG: N-6 DNA methylase [Tyzzerella sp.]|nr:N-6 DNA methylase [Tyzzerella sp.]
MNTKCQVFTPEDYVRELLDSVEYTQQLYGKRILENSCGDGNILVAIVQRYIDDCQAHGLSPTKIKNGLGRDIWGAEIDPIQYEKCIENLNTVLQQNNINAVKWKVFNVDYLRWNEKTQFHYIVGNPPYITYSELKEKEQEYVKDKFTTCIKGKFDYCYAFIEKSIRSLTPDGKMSYLIPSSIFKTVFGLNLRNFMRPYIVEIKDYTQKKIFDDALVKSAIMVLDKQRQQDVLRYTDMTLGESSDIQITDLSEKWFFTNELPGGLQRFGDCFKVSHVVATLLNEAYVLDEDECVEVEQGYLYNGHFIEGDVVRETATPRTLRYNKREKIIFPYRYDNGRLQKFAEGEFERLYPGATAYLNQFREKLDKRKSDKNSKWYEYGRSQALTGLDSEKLLISTIITEEVSVNTLTRECIPYAGMYIVPRENNERYTFEDAIRILRSEEFKQYVEDVGIHISGSSVRITSKDVEDYRF